MTFKEFFFMLCGWIGVAVVVWTFSAIVAIGIYDYMKQKPSKQERKEIRKYLAQEKIEKDEVEKYRVVKWYKNGANYVIRLSSPEKEPSQRKD